MKILEMQYCDMYGNGDDLIAMEIEGFPTTIYLKASNFNNIKLLNQFGKEKRAKLKQSNTPIMGCIKDLRNGIFRSKTL
jgi:hypothetical protein